MFFFNLRKEQVLFLMDTSEVYQDNTQLNFKFFISI
jgi:hypothetical protein